MVEKYLFVGSFYAVNAKFELSMRVAPNGLRVGDVALCCACGKAILLTRC
jgi:hypothetical protein